MSRAPETAAPQGRVSFRDDGASALEWVARYLETVRERRVLAQVEPGAIRARLPASAPRSPRSRGTWPGTSTTTTQARARGSPRR